MPEIRFGSRPPSCSISQQSAARILGCFSSAQLREVPLPLQLPCKNGAVLGGVRIFALALSLRDLQVWIFRRGNLGRRCCREKRPTVCIAGGR